jgi:RNA polymerase sigma factor (sigma-70 family)
MNVHISYRVRKTPDVEKEFQHFIQKLQQRLQVFRPELIHLKGSVEENSPRQGFVVALNLRLPSGQMAAQESGSKAATAIKSAFDELLQQLNKHKALLRSSQKSRRRKVLTARLNPRVAFEETVAAVHLSAVSPEDVRSYVNAHLGRLERFVEREIYFREEADQFAPGTITREEVIDEAIARALDDNDRERPERVTLEPWLYRLALRAMDDLASSDSDGAASVHLEESARKPNVRASDEAELQFHQPDETLTEETVIADRRVATPEDIAYSDEMISLIEFAMRGMRPADREAFILYAIEGFSVEEITAITERRAEEVRASITAGREHVRRDTAIEDRPKRAAAANRG